MSLMESSDLNSIATFVQTKDAKRISHWDVTLAVSLAAKTGNREVFMVMMEFAKQRGLAVLEILSFIDGGDEYPTLFLPFLFGHESVAMEMLSLIDDQVCSSIDKDNYLLHATVRGGNLALCKCVLDRRRENVNLAWQQQTPLHLASSLGFVSVAELLLQHGACLEYEDSSYLAQFQVSCLPPAIFQGHIDMVKFLISKGANVNIAGLRQPADLYQRMITPLEAAIECQNLSIVRCMLQNNARMNPHSQLKPSFSNNGILQLFEEYGIYTKFIYSTDRKDMSLTCWRSCFEYDTDVKFPGDCIQLENLYVMRLMFENGVEAVRRSLQEEILELYFDKANDVHDQYFELYVAFLERWYFLSDDRSYAASTCLLPSRTIVLNRVLFSCIWKDLKKMKECSAITLKKIAFLFDHGANPNMRLQVTHSLLQHLYVEFHCAEYLSALLDVFIAYGYDTNGAVIETQTTLLMTVVEEGESLTLQHLQQRNELVAKLLQADARVDMADRKSKTALHHFVSRIVKLKSKLRAMKAVTRNKTQALDADLFRQLITAGGDLQAVDEHGESAQVLIEKYNLTWLRP